MKLLQRFAAGCLLAVAAILPCASFAQTQIPVWYDLQVQGDIAYLLRKSPAEIMRYDLAQETWLAPLPLAEIPTAFTVDSTRLFVGTGRKIERFDLLGNNKAHVTNTNTDVRQMLIDGSFLFVSLAGAFTSYNVDTNLLVDTFDTWYSGAGATISRANNHIFHMSSGVSPGDIHRLAYDNGGQLLTDIESPYHGDYPHGDRAFVFPDGSKATNTGGTVYNANDLTYNNSFGNAVTDLAFYGDEIPIVLSGDRLHSYSRALVRTGSATLSRTARNIRIRGTRIFAFYEDASLPMKVGVQVVDVATLTPPPLGQPISPEGLAYAVTDAAIDARGVIHLLSKAHNSVFRWDTGTQRYLTTIPLPEAADILEYAPALDRLYVYAASRTVYRIDLGGAAPQAAVHLQTPNPVNRLVPMGTDLLAHSLGSWDAQWLYRTDGSLLLTPLSCCYHEYHFYDAPRARLFVGQGYRPYLGNGTFGTLVGSTWGNTFRPIAVSNDGQRLIDARGYVFETNAMTQIDTLSNDIVAAHWSPASDLYTVKTPFNNGSPWEPVYEDKTTVQKWSRYFAVERSLDVPGQFREMFPIDARRVVITMESGVPRFTILDESFTLVPPPTLDAPVLALERYSATAALLSWNDVQGELSYSVERRVAGTGTWSTVATVPFNRTRHGDNTLVSGAVHEYRIRAANGGLVSPWSNIVSVDLQTTPGPRVDPRTVTFVPDEVFAASDRVFLLSRANDSIFVWNIAKQDWGTTIPLRDGDAHVAFSPVNRAIYTAYGDGDVDSISVDAAEPSEIPFVHLASGASCTLAAAGQYVVTCNPGSSWTTLRSFDAVGTPMSTTDSWRYAFERSTWSDANRRLYHFRDGISPNDLRSTPVAEDGTIGAERESPYHSSEGIAYPIRVSPNGAHVVLGSGRIYDALTLEHLATMPGTIQDAMWLSGVLVTAQGAMVSERAGPAWAATPKLTLPYPIIRMFALPKGFVAVMRTPTNGTEISVYDATYAEVEAPIFIDHFE